MGEVFLAEDSSLGRARIEHSTEKWIARLTIVVQTARMGKSAVIVCPTLAWEVSAAAASVGPTPIRNLKPSRETAAALRQVALS